jgi:murein DD-endopeptidase MepM/ murein hydrolase activator NlpD
VTRRTLLTALVFAAVATAVPVHAAPASAAGTWVWPVIGPVIRGFDPPDDPYGAGHRGIDIAVPFGTPVLAAETGVVTFAGKVGGQLFVTVDHGGGLVSSSSWVSALFVRKNDVVARGQAIALSGSGHPNTLEPPHLHFGVRLNGQYVDPMAYLSPLTVAGLIRLAPLAPAA